MARWGITGVRETGLIPTPGRAGILMEAVSAECACSARERNHWLNSNRLVPGSPSLMATLCLHGCTAAAIHDVSRIHFWFFPPPACHEHAFDEESVSADNALI